MKIKIKDGRSVKFTFETDEEENLFEHLFGCRNLEVQQFCVFQDSVQKMSADIFQRLVEGVRSK